MMNKLEKDVRRVLLFALIISQRYVCMYIIRLVFRCLQAFLHMVRMEQERSAKEMEREAELRRKKQAEVKRIKKFLEAAFDGEFEILQSLLSEVFKQCVLWACMCTCICKAKFIFCISSFDSS